MRVFILIAFAVWSGAQTPDFMKRIANGQALYNSGDINEAERALAALAASSEASKQGAFAQATVWSNLGVIYQDMGRAAEAERAFQKARTFLEGDTETPDSRVLLRQTLNNLAAMYLETGQPGKAEHLIEILAKSPSTDEDNDANVKGTIASLHMVRERNREAEKMFLSLLSYWEKKPNKPKETAVVLNNLGVLALRRKDPRAAVSHLERSLEYWRQAFGQDHPTSLAASANYGYALLLDGSRNTAEEVLGRALAQAKRIHGEAPMTMHLTVMYSAALEANGRKKEARKMKDEAERMSTAWAPTDPARHTVDIRDLAGKR